MTPTTPSPTRRCRGERGGISLTILVMIPALLAAVALVVDGGRQIEARRDLHGTATVAARAAAQMTPDELFAGRLDPTLAEQRATHIAGTDITVDVAGATVTVTATGHVAFVMLPLVGLDGRDLTATATATVLAGIDQGVTR